MHSPSSTDELECCVNFSLSPDQQNEITHRIFAAKLAMIDLMEAIILDKENFDGVLWPDSWDLDFEAPVGSVVRGHWKAMKDLALAIERYQIALKPSGMKSMPDEVLCQVFLDLVRAPSSQAVEPFRLPFLEDDPRVVCSRVSSVWRRTVLRNSLDFGCSYLRIQCHSMFKS